MKEKEVFDDVSYETTYNDDGSFTVKMEQDTANVQAIIDANRADRSARGKDYKGNLVHVMRLPVEWIEQAKQEGYNLYSHDPDEQRRALVYIQENYSYAMSVDGKAIGRKRVVWQ